MLATYFSHATMRQVNRQNAQAVVDLVALSARLSTDKLREGSIWGPLSEESAREVVNRIKQNIGTSLITTWENTGPELREFVRGPAGAKMYFTLANAGDAADQSYFKRSFAMNALRSPEWAESAYADRILDSVLSAEPLWGGSGTERGPTGMMWSNTLWFVFQHVFASPLWQKRPHTLQALEAVVERYHDRPEAYDWILRRIAEDPNVLRGIGGSSKILRALMSNPDDHWRIVRYAMPFAASNPDAASILIDLIRARRSEGDVVWHVLSQPAWARRPEAAAIIRELIDAGTVDSPLDELLHSPEWSNQPDLLRVTEQQAPAVELLRQKRREGKFL
jgi:hypothetical protein